MLIKAIDHSATLFLIRDALPQDLVRTVLQTDWANLPWQRQPGQEQWRRRRIDESVLPWKQHWDQCMQQLWPNIAAQCHRTLQSYQGTAWWLDEPGFTCDLHTDGEMPGAMQLTWIGANQNLGTAFYHYKNTHSLRYQFELEPNCGYIMFNMADSQGARYLQWHGMLNAVPEHSFRLTSYSWITEDKSK